MFLRAIFETINSSHELTKTYKHLAFTPIMAEISGLPVKVSSPINGMLTRFYRGFLNIETEL